MHKLLWGILEVSFRLLVVGFSFVLALQNFIRAFGRAARLYLGRSLTGPRSEVFEQGNLLSRLRASIPSQAIKLANVFSIPAPEKDSKGSLRVTRPLTMRGSSGCTIVLSIDDQLVRFYLVDESGTSSFVSSHPKNSWSEILFPIGKLCEEVRASEIVVLCSHQPHDSLPILAIRDVLLHHSEDLVYLPPTFRDDRFDRWLVDTEGRLIQLDEPHAWWNVLVDRKSSVAPGFPVAMTIDTLEFASEYLEKMAPDSASIVKLGLMLQQSGRAIWELRESSTVTTEVDPKECSREYPHLPASLAQSLRSEFPGVINSVHPQREFQQTARGLSAIESKSLNPRRTGGTDRPLKVLYLSPFATHPVNHGNRKTMVSFGEVLKNAGIEILFASPMDWDTTPQDIRLMEDFWGSVETLPAPDQPIGPYGADFDSWITPEICSRVRFLCIQNQIDVVVCSYVWFSAVLDFVPGYITKILDTHDRFSDRFVMLETRGLPREFFSCTPEEERRYLSRADVVLARRSEEAEYFQSLVPGTPVEVVTHIDRLRSVASPPEGIRLRFGFLASRNQVNAAIIVEFLNAIIAYEAELDFDLVIAGQVIDLVSSELIREASNALKGRVKTLGFVENLEDFYSQIHCMVSPVSIGTGVNVKTLEALSFGMPTLSTKHGSKGTGSTLPEHNFVSVEKLISAMAGLRFAELRPLRLQAHRIAQNLWSENSRRLLSVVTSNPGDYELGVSQ